MVEIIYIILYKYKQLLFTTTNLLKQATLLVGALML